MKPDSTTYKLSTCCLILLNFRLNAIVFNADIKQMYRRILIKPSQCDYQRIFWYFDVNEPVQEYQLKTVTYEVVTAPFLAMRIIHQVAMDKQNNYQLTAQTLQSDIFAMLLG